MAERVRYIDSKYKPGTPEFKEMFGTLADEGVSARYPVPRKKAASYFQPAPGLRPKTETQPKNTGRYPKRTQGNNTPNHNKRDETPQVTQPPIQKNILDRVKQVRALRKRTQEPGYNPNLLSQLNGSIKWLNKTFPEWQTIFDALEGINP